MINKSRIYNLLQETKVKVEVNAVDSYDLESAVINTVKITEYIQSAIDILDNN